MRSFLLLCCVTIGLFAGGCKGKDQAKINVTVDGVNKGKIALKLLNVNKLELVDTLLTDQKGSVSKKIMLPNGSPNFYYLSYNGVEIANLLLAPGDNVKVSVDSNGRNLKIRGSKESELLQQINEEIGRSQKSFDSLTVALLTCNQTGDIEGAQNARFALGRVYVKAKQAAIKHLLTHPYSFTNIRNIYRDFSENLPLFAHLNDGVYFKQLADSLRVKYPNSQYVKALDDEVVKFYNEMELTNKIQSVDEILFPDLVMPDILSQERRLSDLAGKPFMLLFWTPEDSAQKMLNAELEAIYNRYRSRGFEIYSVCITTDKAYWNSVVNRFPWINVCDGAGAASKALATYNVQNLPAMYLFNSSGAIVGKDIFEPAAISKAVSSVCLE
ncbi:MAG: TlpA family protein disulfide reductase [Bacteroidales bacterium]|nr:TlpA family protein disulfide reductase [Bacteroidales bacterium]